MPRPIVLVPACHRQLGSHAYHSAQDKYLHAVVAAAGCMPLLLPALGQEADLEAALRIADGVLLTGSASNVDARLYGQEIAFPELPQDTARDATTLPLIRAALARQLPLFAICRGFQEVNVAPGGSLHQAVHGVPGMLDHRENINDPLARQYGPAHRIRLTPGALLSRVLGGESEMMVNSLHGQGIARLADGLLVEALADDGLVGLIPWLPCPALHWACSGIRSGRWKTTRNRCACSRHSARPAASINRKINSAPQR